METYTITAENGLGEDVASIRVMAESHMQHIYSETKLIGVTKTGAAKLAKFQRDHAGMRLRTDATKYNPRLVGWTTQGKRVI